MSKYYTPPPQVKDGDIAYARDVNDINNNSDTAFELVEADVDAKGIEIDEKVEKAHQWAENPYGDQVEPGQYSSLHHATESATSASQSAVSADLADSARIEANQSRDDAQSAASASATYRDEAEDYAIIADTRATEAASSASSASTSASEALTYRDQTEQYKYEAEAARDSVVGDADSAAQSASEANSARLGAQTAASVAISSAEESSNYADEAEGYKDLAYTYSQDAQSVVTQDLTSKTKYEAFDTDVTSVFIYDTSKDPDGGAWREKCENLSWYREELNTSTRGTRRKFPALAIIVAEADKVTILDGDDPEFGLWMSFSSAIGENLIRSRAITGVHMLYGVLTVVGDNVGSSYSSCRINFKNDSTGYGYTSINNYFGYDGSIAERHDGKSFNRSNNGFTIVDVHCTDVSMAMLDDNLEPTIAITTETGVTIVDGTAGIGTDVNITGAYWHSVEITSEGRLMLGRGGNDIVVSGVIPDADITYSLYQTQNAVYASVLSGATQDMYLPTGSPATIDQIVAEGAIGGNYGITMLKENPMNPSEGMIHHANTAWVTGWMFGDIRVVTSSSGSDSDSTGDSDTEQIYNGWFHNGTTGWTSVNQGDLEVTPRGLKITNEAASYGRAEQADSTIPGVKYDIKIRAQDGNQSGRILVGTTSGGVDVLNAAVSGSYTGSFIATTNTTFIAYSVNSATEGDYTYLNEISVRESNSYCLDSDFPVDTANKAAFDAEYGDNWTSPDGHLISTSGGTLTVDRNGGSYGELRTTFKVPSTGNYDISFDLTVVAGSLAVVSGGASSRFSTGGSKSITVNSSGTDLSVYLAAVDDTNAEYTISNLVVSRTSQLVPNGGFQADTFWSKGDGWTIPAGQEKANCDGTQALASQIAYGGLVSANTKYFVQYTVENYVAGNVHVALGDATSTPVSANGTYTATLIPTSGNNVAIVGDANFSGDISSIAVLGMFMRDRCYKDNTLLGRGISYRHYTAQGTDISWWGSYSEDDYMVQFDHEVYFGSDDFYIASWIRLDDSATDQVILHKGVQGSATKYIQLSRDSADRLQFSISDGTNTATVLSPEIPLYTPQFVVARRNGANIEFLINGILVAQESVGSVGSTDVAGSLLYIGRSLDTTANAFEGGYTSLLRVGGGSPSESQIKYAYDTERRLYEKDGKAKLPFRKVINSISYDRDTDKHIIGLDDTGLSAEYMGISRTDRSFAYDDGVNPTWPAYEAQKRISTAKGIVLMASGISSFIWMPSLNLKEEIYREALELYGPRVAFKSTGAGQTSIQVEEGFYPEAVYDAGLLVDFTVTSDGFKNYVNITASTGDVTVIARRN